MKGLDHHRLSNDAKVTIHSLDHERRPPGDRTSLLLDLVTPFSITCMPQTAQHI